MQRKTIAHLLIVIAILFGLAGCQLYDAQPVETPTASSYAFRVALLLPRPVDADGWTRAGYQGLLLIQEELGAEIAYSENVPEADFEKVYRQYAQDGFDFIIGHGAQFVAAAEKVAAEFPEIDFAVAGGGSGNNVNLGGLSLREGEMAYLFGVIAATKTQTKRVAYLGGTENSSNQEITALFRRGIEATDPSVQVRIDWVGDFVDEAKAEQLAAAQIGEGVDVIFVLAGAAGTGVHAQAERAGIFTLGWIEDMSHLAPQAVLTSNVQDVSQMLLAGATIASQGRWEGKLYRFGLAERAQNLAPFRGLLTAEEEKQILSVEHDILTGKIDTAP